MKKAFTLTELLVVIGIIAILASLILAAVLRSREAASKTSCASNLRQIGVAVRLYLDEEDCFPAAANMPSLGLEDLPSIRRALATQLDGAKDVFRCPMDTEGYFEREESSYEWNMLLNGRKRDTLSFFGKPPEDSEIRLLQDYEPFHGESGTKGSRNLLYLDTVVKPL